MLFVYGERALEIAKGAMACGMKGEAVFSFGIGEEAALAQAICRYAPRPAAILFKASAKMKLGNIVKMIGVKW